MKAIKILASILVALLVVIAIALAVGVRNLDRLVEAAIESVGPTVTGTDVSVEQVDIDLTEGRGRITGFRVANPEGFSSEALLSVDEVELVLDTGSITDDVVVIESIRVDGAHLRAEHRGTGFNFEPLLERVRAASEGDSSRSTTASPDVRFMVERLEFAGAGMSLHSDQFGQRQYRLEPIELSDLGDRQTGLGPNQFARALLEPLLEAAEQRLEDELREQAGEALEEELSEEDRETLDRVRSLAD